MLDKAKRIIAGIATLLRTLATVGKFREYFLLKESCVLAGLPRS